MKKLALILSVSLLCCVAQAATNAINIISAQVTSIPITQEVNTFGTLKAVNQVLIATEVAGKISTIFFKDGQMVKKGALILQLDNTQAKANLVSAEADLELSKRNQQRYEELSKYGGTTKQQLDKMRADVNAKEATVQSDLNMLQKYTLTAPFTGRLGDFQVNPGDYVTVGQGLVTLVNNKPLKIVYTLPESAYTHVKLKQAAIVTTSTIKNKKFKAKVSYVAPYIDSTTGTLAVQATLQNKDGLLSPGMFVYIRQIFKTENSLVVPEVAVQTSLAGSYVYKVDGDKAIKTPVEVSAFANGYAQITSGLKKNDTIVAEGALKLENNSTIKTIGKWSASHKKPSTLTINKNQTGKSQEQP